MHTQLLLYGHTDLTMRRLLMLLWLLTCMPGASAEPLAVGGIPADFLGKTPDSEEVSISQFKGRVVVVTFWASWCQYCAEELPYLDVLQRRAGELVRLVAVNGCGKCAGQRR